MFLRCSLALMGICFFTFFKVTAMASDAGLICSNPLKVICSDTETQRIERSIRINKMKKEIAQDAQGNYKNIYAVIENHFGNIENVINKENINKIKSYLYEAILASDFDFATKDRFKEIINSTVVGNYSDYLRRMNIENLSSTEADSIFRNSCGVDGMLGDAFSTSLGGERYVLLCPGILISLSQKANDQERFVEIIHTLAHELGHQIDNSNVERALYEPYLNCMTKHYADEIEISDDIKALCELDKLDESECNKLNVDYHSRELIADQWGFEASAIYAARSHFSSVEAEKMFALSFERMCGTEDGGMHPSGEFRIKTLMRKNFSINNILGCTPSDLSQKPFCSFGGAIKN